MSDDTIKMIIDSLQRIEEKQDHFADKMDERVKNLESCRDKAIGVLGLLSLFAGAIGSAIYKLLSLK
jgi:hypothetical protein